MSRDGPRRLRLEHIALVLLAAAVVVLGYREYTREEPPPAREAFERIYREGLWAKDAQGKGTSGYGSTLEFTKLYRVFLQDFLAAHQIRSVVDAGCGDWEFSQAIDWKGIRYLGVDIAPSVIAANQRRFEAANVRFAVADIVRDPLPPADLLLVKDVLQHLSNADITLFFRQLQRYRHVLIVNDVLPESLSAEAADIQTGRYRPIDVTRPPFALAGTKVLAWHDGRTGTAKLVIHVERK
jgi:SAM-dependent methyltransferase